MGSTSTTVTAPNAHFLLRQIEGLVQQLRGAVTDAVTTAPGLTLTPVELARLETLLGASAPLTPATLYVAVDRLASMRIGDIRIPFTPGQLAELQHRAHKRGRTVEAEMQAVVARIQDELFYQGG